LRIQRVALAPRCHKTIASDLALAVKGRPMTAPTFEKLKAPQDGTRVTVGPGGKWNIPDDPIVCLLRGDGIGMDVGGVPGITTAAVKVLDAAVKKAYGGKRRLVWFDVHAGDMARKLYSPNVTDEQVST